MLEITNCSDIRNFEMHGKVANCDAIVGVTVNESATHGFESCSKLDGCTATASAKAGFYRCQELENSTATGNTLCGFSGCIGIDPTCTESGNGGEECDTIPGEE